MNFLISELFFVASQGTTGRAAARKGVTRHTTNDLQPLRRMIILHTHQSAGTDHWACRLFNPSMSASTIAFMVIKTPWALCHPPVFA